jgi:DNA repair exonuclease SbcCD ATPase subunit
MTHLSMEMLLSLREPGAEPGTATAREHLSQCPQCQAELDRLHQRVARLKALAPLRPGRDRWPQTAARYRAERLRRRTRVGGAAGLAAAAAIAVMVATGGQSGSPADAAPTSAQITQAMERSQALEDALSAYNPDARVLDGRTAGMAQELEDRIARLDRELEATELLEQQARDDELLRLWRERVGLLDALVDVHVTRASNAGL